MTSCLVSCSMASMRARSTGPMFANASSPRARMTAAAWLGIWPSAAMASAAKTSIWNQMRNRFSGAQIATIPGRL